MVVKKEVVDERGPVSPIQRVVAPTKHTLHGFLDLSGRLEHIRIEELVPLTSVTVNTTNSTYDITLIDPQHGEILIRGGHMLPLTTRARLLGSSFGSGLLWLRRVAPGMRMEVVAGKQRIVTTPVVRVEVESDSVAARPS